MPESDDESADLANRSPAMRWLFHRVPALDSLRTYSRASFGRDLTAGLTVATVAVPQAMAYAMLAGLPPQYGLYTAIVMTAVGALLDSSRQLINGPTNAISIALLSALLLIPEGERIQAAIALAFLVGAIQLGIAFLRLGDLTRFVSHSVIVGFTLGASTLLVLDQTKHLLGLVPRGAPNDHFLTRFWLTVSGGVIHWPTVLVGVGTIAVVVAIRQVNTVLRRRGFRFPIPQHLVAVALLAALVWGFNLHAQGVQIVGAVPSSLPAFDLPELKWEQTRLLAGSAFAIAVLGLLEAIAMAKAIAARTGQKLDVNQQCLSEGGANLAGSFFQCFPGSGSLTRSAVNQQAGAVSQWSGVFAALAVAVTVLLFAPFASYIPRASLAGLLILAAYRMVDGRQLLFHLRATRFDAGVVAATALAALFISVEFCIVIGVFLSFALYIPKAAQVKLTSLTVTPEGSLREKLPDDSTDNRLLAFEIDGELFFGTEVELARHISTVSKSAQGEVRVVILVLKRGRNPDAGFLNQLRDLHETLRARGVILLLCGVQTDLMKCLTTTHLARMIGLERIFADGANGQPAEGEAIKFAQRFLAEEASAPESVLTEPTLAQRAEK
ncbi:MAG: SulP family inorganic anion transporter [Planctomycetia bacterium]|nr:SulP family inorganic anion transporter [Planctomycetia bacterium]